MARNPIYGRISQEESLRRSKARLALIETQALEDNRAELIANKHGLSQHTAAAGAKSWGRYRGGVTGTTVTIDEDTNANIVARTNFEDPFGTGTPIDSPFTGGMVSLPMFDYDGKTAFYHGSHNPAINAAYMYWDIFDSPVAHTKLHAMSRSFRLNVPGTATADRNAFVYYNTSTDFDISGDNTHALWFYPVAVADAAETFTFLQWRYQDASNWYAIVMKNSNSQIQVHVRETAVTTKREVTTPVTYDAWNLVIWTYDATSNVLTIRLNNISDSATPSETLSVPYITNTNMYLGNIPTSTPKRFEGWFGQYVAWNIELTGTQQSNFWSHGTIV